jgi:Uma2 family endonuclease
MIQSSQKFDRKSLPEYPFDIGYRWVKDGSVDVQVPLTEEDFLHPEEEDRFMSTEAHVQAVTYLWQAIQSVHRDRSDIHVFCEHRVDWQEDGVRPMGPDVAVYDHFEDEWDRYVGTVPVQEWGITPILVIEVTSISTRLTDLERKPQLYDEAKVPYFLIFDFYSEGGLEVVPALVALRRTKRGYVRMKVDAEYGFWVPTVEMWFKFEGDRVVARDSRKERILSSLEKSEKIDEQQIQLLAEKQRAEHEKHRAEAEKQRAEHEKQRAEHEKQRAEHEKQRADELAKELAELKAKLANPSTKKNGHK